MQWSDLELYAIKSYARAAVDAYRAQRVPDGWVLVPVEPTPDMCAAAFEQQKYDHRRGSITLASNCYRAMLDAAPMFASTPAQPAPTPAAPDDEQISLHTITDPVRRAAHEAYANQPDGQGHYVRMEAVIAAVKSALATAQPAQQEPSIPAEFDVRTILLSISPGEDGMGHEVYAASVADVEGLLTSMGQELEEWQLGIRRLPTAAHQEQPQPEQRCSNCDGTGDVHSIDGEWRGTCHCPAGQATKAVAPQPVERKPMLPPGHCASDWGGRPTGPCLYTDDEVIEILAAHGIRE